MPTAFQLTGAGELHLDARTGDNVLLRVDEVGNARQLGADPNERWIRLGWWAPLIHYVDPDANDLWWAGYSRFLEHLAVIDAIPDLWPTNGGFDGIRYHFEPGVVVTLWA